MIGGTGMSIKYLMGPFGPKYKILHVHNLAPLWGRLCMSDIISNESSEIIDGGLYPTNDKHSKLHGGKKNYDLPYTSYSTLYSKWLIGFSIAFYFIL